MSKVFVEYHILPQHRSAYSQWIKNVRDVCPGLELLEGADQPGLFVELWTGLTRKAYEQMKQKRHYPSDQPFLESDHTLYNEVIHWRDLDEWVQGGAEKIHIWYFHKVR
jgi:hypothetical protein